MVTAYYFGARQSPGTLSVMPGLDPGIHLLRKNALREADGLHRNSGLPEFRIIMSAASRAGPTCGVKPGNDAVSWRARGAIHARQTRSAPSPACGGGVGWGRLVIVDWKRCLSPCSISSTSS